MARTITSQVNMARAKRLFIEKYPEYGSVWLTLRAIGVKSRRTFYRWCESDPRFKEVYLSELLPNRRDELVSRMYQIATGNLKASDTELRALFGFLKATDHISKADPYDTLVFADRNQVELTGSAGGPIEQRTEVRLSGNDFAEALRVLAGAGAIRMAASE